MIYLINENRVIKTSNLERKMQQTKSKYITKVYKFQLTVATARALALHSAVSASDNLDAQIVDGADHSHVRLSQHDTHSRDPGMIVQDLGRDRFSY